MILAGGIKKQKIKLINTTAIPILEYTMKIIKITKKTIKQIETKIYKAVRSIYKANIATTTMYASKKTWG